MEPDYFITYSDSEKILSRLDKEYGLPFIFGAGFQYSAFVSYANLTSAYSTLLYSSASVLLRYVAGGYHG